MKKKSGIFSFRVNDILTSILSALHLFLTLPNDVLKHKRGTSLSLSSYLMKGAKRYLFSSWKRCSQKRQNGTFFAVGSNVVKVRKRYLFKRLSLKQGTGNWRMGEWETGNGESLKWGIFKTGNL